MKAEDVIAELLPFVGNLVLAGAGLDGDVFVGVPPRWAFAVVNVGEECISGYGK